MSVENDIVDFRHRFIDGMRGVAQVVTVVTTDGPAGRHGATVSAFNSITADPPSVFVCLKADSRIAQSVRINEKYCVNVLPYDGQGIANQFAGRIDQEFEDRFQGIPLKDGVSEAPEIIGATTFQCKLVETVTHGSHHILIGNVQDVQRSYQKPLAYYDGDYHIVKPHN
ncbi:flavin reductase family protein [Curvivirga sp.]|uniref:flavin reductase family protein n=1 Tax=Curvivirga sp. TaxID=2856848 RepID=UPI003B597DAC